MQAGENSFCRNSDVVVSLLPAAKNYFIEHGMKPEKFIHVPNGIVMEEWEKYEHIPQDLSVHFFNNSAKGKFNLCFFGSINKTSGYSYKCCKRYETEQFGGYIYRTWNR